MKNFALAAAAPITILAALAAAPAMAQDAGATVMGNDEAAVGTVVSNDGTTVILNTGTWEVPLGTEAFADHDGTWVLNTTKAELDATFAQMVAEREAALTAALVVGAEVKTADAQPLGTIEEVQADGILVTHGGEPMQLPLELFALDTDGSVMVLTDMATIMQALAAQQG